MEKYQLIIAAIALLGIGAILKGFFDVFFFDRKKLKDQARQEYKEERYKAILLLCHAYLHYEQEKEQLLGHRPDLTSIEKLRNELKTELINSSLYASDKVILALRAFIQHPSEHQFIEILLAMRRSLYGVRTKLDHTTFLDLN